MTPASDPALPVIGVADQTPVFLHGMLGVLGTQEFTVLGVGTATEARDLIGKHPDLMVLDVRILRCDPTLCRLARESGIPLILTVDRNSSDGVMEAVRAGVTGLWDRDGDIPEMRRIIAGALTGTTVMSADVGGALLDRIAAASEAVRGTAGKLTTREREILKLMADGAGNRAIADTLFISENTVRNHVRNVLDKLQATTRTEAVVRAARAGLVRLG